jgi:serine/threonine protein kinase
MNLYDAYSQAIAYPNKEQQQDFLQSLQQQSRDIAEKLILLLTAAEQAGERTLNVQKQVAQVANEFCQTDISANLVGMHLGIWQCDSLIALGGMSAVYKASRQDGQFEQQVAIKVLNPLIYPVTEHSKAFDEAGLCARLNHPAITTILDGGVVELQGQKAHYIVMEFVDGVSLSEWLAQNRPNLDTVLKLLIALCDALQYAHNHQVIHADLKPANILVDSAGRPRLIDFGISQLQHQAAAQSSDVSCYVRAMSVGFASPEQLNGESLSTLADIYSLGKVLEVCLKHLKIKNLNIQELDAVIRKATDQCAEHRYLSIRDLHIDIQGVLDKKPVGVFKNTLFYKLEKFVLRQPWVTAFILTTAVSVATGVVGVTLALLETEQQRKIANDASENERKRAEQLAQVVEFQSQQLKNIDPLTFGLNIRKQVLTQLNLPQNKNQHLDQLNYTDIGLNALKYTVFEKTITAINKHFAQEPQTRASLLQSTALAMMELGLVKRALEIQTLAVKVNEDNLGQKHQQTLNSKSYLSEAFFRLGNLEHAAEIVKSVLSDQRKVLSGEHPDLLTSMNHYGLILTSQNKFSEAEQIFLESLKIASTSNVALSHTVLELHNNIGILYYHLDKLEKSLHHIGIARDGHLKLDGEENITFITNSLNYAAILQRNGNKQEAQKVFEETAEVAERTIGSEHPNTLINKGNYANLLIENGDYVNASRLLKECIEIGIKTLGKTHDSVIIWHDSLASTLFYLEEFSEAERYYRETLELSIKVFGEKHLSTLDTKEKLARTLQAQSEYKEAEIMLGSILDAFVNTRMTEHRQFFGVQNSLAILLREMGRFNESEVLSLKILNSTKEILTEKNFELASFQMEYGITLLKLNKLQESLQVLEPAHAQLQKIFGDKHRLSQKATLHLVELYQKLFDVTTNNLYQEKMQKLKA